MTASKLCRIATASAVGIASLCLASAASASSINAGIAGTPRFVSVNVTVRSADQAALAADGKLELRIAGHGRGLVGVAADDGTGRTLTYGKGIVFSGESTQSVTLRLNPAGRSYARSCAGASQRWRVITKSGTRKITRTVNFAGDENACLPPEAEVACRGGDPLDRSRCLLPFPNNLWTRPDSSTPTGIRLDLPTALMPTNDKGVRLSPARYNMNDGFSGNSTLITRVPGLDTPAALASTGAATVRDIGRSLEADSPIVVIDAATKQRWPIWSEVDMSTSQVGKRLLLTHGAKVFEEGHTYIVAMRNLKRADGSAIDAKQIFKWYRDGSMPATAPARLKARSAHMESLFSTLADAGIARSSLYVAWDFTIASRQNVTDPALTMRNKAFAALGDTNLADGVAAGSSPVATVTAVQNYSLSDSRYVLRRVDGTVRVPCFMGHTDSNGKEVGPCRPGTEINLGSDGLPAQARDAGGNLAYYDAKFTCIIPRAGRDSTEMGTDRRAVLFGHGLLGTGADVTSIKGRAGLDKAIACGADWVGLSREDIGNAVGTLSDLSRFPALADRSMQGLINFLYLGRWMISQAPGGMNDTADFKPSSGELADPAQKLYFLGGSQGGIMGTALTAIAPDFEKSLLAVPAVGYSTLLNRSAAFELFSVPLSSGYPDPASQQILLSLVQTLWDRGEGGGYVHHITTNTLPDTPAHKVLMIEAFGDHLVTNIQTETMARTIGAVVRTPILDPDRSPDREPFFGIARGDSSLFTTGGYDGSAGLVVIDIGPLRGTAPNFRGVTPEPPYNIYPVAAKGNEPNNGRDPHADVATSDTSVTILFDFLKPDGTVTTGAACGLVPCYAEGWTGPN